ncbi:alpha-ketoglutarate-dependent dioxygenase alkB homolog 6 [Trichoderma asperellum]|uniref:Alpha-ketoglutarate-dependent dioxygenase alkB homolog 6 n=1 Tax=Trichoderma asperellum TaxID=101201 RepID=A0A6V8QKC7_TRIAP|nr:alpha-ketoglutarate-dependent dioxygenase alkB homolog 6 [Trichoderma asperellum]
MATAGTGDARLPSSLEAAKITSLPPTSYYVPNFISEEEERVILDKTWPSDLVQDRLLDASLPPWLETPVVSRLLSLPLSDDDDDGNADGAAYWPVVCTISLGASICLNLYRSKEDGALDPEPAWRIIQEPRSLLITTAILYTDYLHGISDIKEDLDLSADTIVNWPLLREPEAFASGQSVRQTRTSLTYRDVLKVSKVGNRLGLFNKR